MRRQLKSCARNAKPFLASQIRHKMVSRTSGQTWCAFFNEGFKRVEEGVVHTGFSLQQSAASVVLVGRSSDEKELSELISSSGHGDRPRVICVWGFPGVGKSALVKAFLSRQEFNQASLFRFYVDMFYPFKLDVFYRRIHSCIKTSIWQQDYITVVEVRKEDKEIIQECIEFLNAHPCIVVIDGLQSDEDWESIRLISGCSQTRIIVVTAEESVAKYCTAEDDDAVYRVKALEPDAALRLFEREFEGTGTFGDSHMLKQVKYILTKCGGIPSVIISLARHFGAQQGDIRQRKLMHLKANFIHELETNPEFDRLRDLFAWMHFKFDDLPQFLLQSILYLSVFPEMKNTRPSHFVRRWIAEGYYHFQSTDGNTVEEDASELFNRLAEHTASLGEWRVNSFFHEYINSRLMDDRVIFRPHVSVLGEKGQSLTVEGRGQHLAIRKSWERDESVFDNLNLTQLQSLTVSGEWKPFFISCEMKWLRVLDLEGAKDVSNAELERILELVPRLRFLSLRGHTEISCLPDSLYGLIHLQTLDIRHTSVVYIRTQKLQNLQYIRAGTGVPWTDYILAAEEQSTPSISRSSTVASSVSKLLRRGSGGTVCLCNGVKVRGGIRHLKALKTLGAVNVNTANGKDILAEMRHLKQLKKLEVSGINRKNSKYLSKAILDQKNLESLSLQLEKENHVVRWDDISPPSSIRSLKLYGHVEKLSALRFGNLRNLRKLVIEMTKLWAPEDMQILGSIHSLLTLRLRVSNDQDGNLEFPAHIIPIKKDQDRKNQDHQADGERQAPDCPPVNKDQDVKPQVPAGCLFSKLQVLEIASKSKLHVRFYEGGMEKLEVMKAHCWDDSPFHLHGLKLKHVNSLKQVWLLGSYTVTYRRNDCSRNLLGIRRNLL